MKEKIANSKMVKAVAETSGFPQKTIDGVLDAVAEYVYKAMAEQDEVVVFKGGVSLKGVIRPERQGHSPRTGEPMTIPEKLIPKASFFKNCKDVLEAK